MAGEISDAIIRVRDITVQFGKTRVLDGLNLDVKRGEILGFVGPSGAGKSVLTRTIIGLVPKVAGRIEVFGVDLDAGLNEVERATAIGVESLCEQYLATASGYFRWQVPENFDKGPRTFTACSCPAWRKRRSESTRLNSSHT